MSNTRLKARQPQRSPPESDEDEEIASSVPILATRWNIAIATTTLFLVAFVAFRCTESRELQQIDQAHIQNLTTQLGQILSQIHKGTSHQQTRTGYRGARVDHAQLSQGAKIIRFSGEEMTDPISYGDRVKQTFGFYVPKGACRILGKRLNKNKFLTFKGDHAKLLIELNRAIYLDTFKIEHFIANLNDTHTIGMMPKDVIVSGIRKGLQKPIVLGQIQLPLAIGSNLQSAVMPINEPRESFERFQVEVLNNHGHKDMTRVYKVRMYGEINDTI